MERCIRTLSIIAACAILFTAGFASAQERLALTIGQNATGFNIPIFDRGRTLYTEPMGSFFGPWFDRLTETVGLEKGEVLFREVREFKNGRAFLYKLPDGTIKRVVLYDPNWLGGRGEALMARSFILAHEIGHHLCNHVSDGLGSTPLKEIEADQAAGALMRTLYWRANTIGLTFPGGLFPTIEETLQALEIPLQESETHPGRYRRLEAVEFGYAHGSSCVKESIERLLAMAQRNVHNSFGSGWLYILGKLAAAKGDHALAVVDLTSAIKRLSQGMFTGPGTSAYVAEESAKERNRSYQALGEEGKAIAALRRGGRTENEKADLLEVALLRRASMKQQ